MLIFDPGKTPAEDLDLSWSAYAIMQSMLTPGVIMTATVAIAMHPNSQVDDPDVASMLPALPVVNGSPLTKGLITFPVGNVVTQRVINGLDGADYVLFYRGFDGANRCIADEQIVLQVRKYLLPRK